MKGHGIELRRGLRFRLRPRLSRELRVRLRDGGNVRFKGNKWVAKIHPSITSFIRNLTAPSATSTTITAAS
jgi:hypothetical protein